jgi:hypothetical protein
MDRYGIEADFLVYVNWNFKVIRTHISQSSPYSLIVNPYGFIYTFFSPPSHRPAFVGGFEQFLSTTFDYSDWF